MINPSAQLARYLEPESTEAAAAVVATYFTPRPTGTFTGAHFELLGGSHEAPPPVLSREYLGPREHPAVLP